jgi:hypothetical protein
VIGRRQDQRDKKEILKEYREFGFKDEGIGMEKRRKSYRHFKSRIDNSYQSMKLGNQICMNYDKS